MVLGLGHPNVNVNTGNSHPIKGRGTVIDISHGRRSLRHLWVGMVSTGVRSSAILVIVFRGVGEGEGEGGKE